MNPTQPGPPPNPGQPTPPWPTRRASAGRAAAGRGAVITGIGLCTPVGSTPEQVFAAVCTGRSGLRRPPDGHPVAGILEVAGIAPDIDPAPLVSGPERRSTDRYLLMALRAADDAIGDAGLRIGEHVAPHRVACVVSATGGLATLADQVLDLAARGRVAISPYLLPGVLPNMGAARIAIRHGIRGYSSSIATACASGAQAVAEALRLLRADEADAVVCGCAEALLFPAFAHAFTNARALAHGWPDPTTASRPFDRRRNGLVLSEGAAVLVLERVADADARGAAGYADVIGWGATTDAHHPTTPHPEGDGAAASMWLALADAGLAPDDVGYINAHGTGTKLGDRAEAVAIRRVFAGSPPVSATKAITGHMLGASGAVEVALTALALSTGALPPTHNLDEIDPACDLDHILTTPRPTHPHFAITNSFGFGGHNITLALAHPSTRTPRPTPTPQTPDQRTHPIHPRDPTARQGDPTAREEDPSTRPGEPTARQGERGPRPGEQSPRPGEQGLRPGERGARPGVQGAHPG